MEDAAWIPETIGKPIQILYWSATEVLMPLLIFIVGFLLSYYIQSIIIFIIYCYIYAKKKDDLPRGYAINLLYMAGALNFKSAPSYFAARFEE